MAFDGKPFQRHGISPAQATVERRPLSWPSFVFGLIAVLALATAVWLWAYLGATIFFEAIRTGFAVCFG